jgi:MFS family permease
LFALAKAGEWGQAMAQAGPRSGHGADDLTTELDGNPDKLLNVEPRWGVFSYPSFVAILVATSLSSVGFAMFDTASAWLMTSLNPSPRTVSAVQVATTLPMFLLTLPAGALTDVVDPRRLLIVAQIGIVAVSIAFAAAVSAGAASPPSLLAASFLLGIGGALVAPAWLLIAPMLVPRSQLDSAIAIDNASYNMARAIGPAIAGYAIARFGNAVPFWCCCLGNLALVGVLVWWRAPQKQTETLPAERLVSAMTAGVRYVRYSREMDATLIRGAAFFLFASAYLALLPLVARAQIGEGPEGYGQLMAAVGLGSIAATFALNWLKARFGPNGLAALGTIGIAVSLFLFAGAHDGATALAASLVAGAAWIIALTTFFVSAQVSLPEWVRGRGLAIFLTVYFGALTLGSAVWGEVASLEGVPFALAAAGVGALIAMALTWPWKLHTGPSLDLTPSTRWRAPAFLNHVANDQGPVLATAEYLIDPKDSAAFLAVMHDISLERRRDGAYAWHIFEDPSEAGKMIETYLIRSALELKYRQSRVTMADQLMEDQAIQFLTAPPQTRYLVAPQRPLRPWRQRIRTRAYPRSRR